ncbi:alpha/beta fold hydrolase [Flavobacteriaceae bacterium R38]|nr:alpha/beta fold hydrolase [Flavobacteriaceae bacterium R38]
MKSKLQHIEILDYTTQKGVVYNRIPLSYQVFGQSLGEAPIVLVNHALTGNSEVTGDSGWWKALIGDKKLIDTNTYSVLAFNIPGNGYDNFTIENYKDFVARDIAEIFVLGLKKLNIASLFAAIGGSLGGGIAWEIAASYPSLIENLIPVASDWKSTDWLMANCLIQDQILNNSSQPIHDARLHAMLCYRSPKSFKTKFNRSLNEELKIFNVESWLLHHGKKLQGRFQVSSYKLMNHLLATIDISRDRGSFLEVASGIKSDIHIVSVDSDLFFTPEEDKEAFLALSKVKTNIFHKTITSIHGHDAFLIEFEQLTNVLKEVFK